MRYPLLLALFFVSCSAFEPDAPADEQLLDGPVDGLSAAEITRFQAGDVAFNDEIFTTQTGLGPLFVATSCGSCHPGDGKGHPFTTLTRFGQIDPSGNNFLHLGGPQLQHRAIPGVNPEVIPLGATFTRLMPPANTGLGFLDAVTDADILAMSDLHDADGDGISGTPNWIELKAYITARPASVPQSGKYIARFGKKGSTYDLLQQTATAYNQDIGVTSSYEPVDTHTGAVIDPEVLNTTVEDVVFYLKTLKVPPRRNAEDPEVLAGEQIFTNIQCAACHRPELETGPSSIAALSSKKFAPYTDLLLHDMGPGLDDGYTEGSAASSEWRTAPLWGLGLAKRSQGGQYFLLHDGRASSIEQAILYHGGEASNAATAFSLLPAAEKQKLIKFLESL